MLAVLRLPGVLPLFVASCVARLPMGALGLLLVLHTKDLTGSYGRGGVAAGVYALSIGLSSPALARFVDRRGQAAVLRVGGVVTAAAITVLALLPEGAPLGAILAASAVAGIAQPPTGACMRALWPVLVRDPAQRHAAYALESVILEVVYMFGPVVIVAGIGSWSVEAAVLLCGACELVGNFAFSFRGASRGWRPAGDRAADALGALRGGGVRVLVGAFLLSGMAIGAIEVGVPALLDETGQRDLTGLLFGFWGIGSMAAGFAVGRAGPGDNPPRRLALLLVLWGAAHAAVGLAGSPLSIALLLLVAGSAIAPTFVCENGMLDKLAPHGTLTEAFTWIATGLTAGIAAGSALGGAITEAASPGTAMLVLGSGGLVAAALVAASASGPLRPARVGAAEAARPAEAGTNGAGAAAAPELPVPSAAARQAERAHR
jgi:MFS family permease